MSGSSSDGYRFDCFNVTFPQQYVAHVEIDRPRKMNAFDGSMFHSLGIIFTRLSHDPNVRCVMLSGAGDRAFTAGLDVQSGAIKEIMGGSKEGEDAARTTNRLRRQIQDFQNCISAIEKCEKPVIAILHGFAYGVALDIALAADIRLCTSANPPTSFSIKEVDIGIAADLGTLARLPRAGISLSWAKEVCLTARVFGAEEALRVGLVSDVRPSKQEALREGLRLAGLIAEKSPVAVIGIKELLNHGRDRGVDESLRYTAAWDSAMFQSEDVKRAALSGMKGKKPTFEKL